MTVRGFSAQRKASWDELRSLLESKGRRRRGLDGDSLRRLGSLYRSGAADLARARRLYPGDPVVTDLERLVTKAHHRVYATTGRRTSVLEFVTRSYWQLIVRARLALAISALCLFLPAVLTFVWAIRDPGSAAGIAPDGFRSVTEPRTTTDLGLSPDAQAAISSQIFTNNIRVTLLTFAAGIILGFGSALVLVFNGILLGVVAGLSVSSGNGVPLLQLIVAHGVLELSCIVVVGAAGLRLGWAIVEPGTLSRGRSLTREARPAILLTLGTAPWLVVAGLVEGYVTGSAASLGEVCVIGGTLGGIFWTLALWRGRTGAETGVTRGRAAWLGDTP